MKSIIHVLPLFMLIITSQLIAGSRENELDIYNNNQDHNVMADLSSSDSNPNPNSNINLRSLQHSNELNNNDNEPINRILIKENSLPEAGYKKRASWADDLPPQARYIEGLDDQDAGWLGRVVSSNGVPPGLENQYQYGRSGRVSQQVSPVSVYQSGRASFIPLQTKQPTRNQILKLILDDSLGVNER